jgi:hypothetical protein
MLQAFSGDAATHILFVAKNTALAYFVAKWLWVRMLEQGTCEEDAQQVLSRFHVLCGSLVARATFTVDTSSSKMVLDEIDESGHFEYSLIVVDEAHHVYSTFPEDFSDRYTSSSTRRLLLSDMAAAMEQYPQMREVVLSEVVRSSKRIVEGARAFQTNDDDEPTKSQQTSISAGPPLKAITFQKTGDDAALNQQYVSKILEALSFVLEQHPGINLRDIHCTK